MLAFFSDIHEADACNKQTTKLLQNAKYAILIKT